MRIKNSYINKDGAQSCGEQAWGNGHFVDYSIPGNVEILDLKYRETSYDTEITGSFECSDDELNILWVKSARSAILNMRDNYMDCPDRERSQWTEDGSMISEYTYSIRKDMRLVATGYQRGVREGRHLLETG